MTRALLRILDTAAAIARDVLADDAQRIADAMTEGRRDGAAEVMPRMAHALTALAHLAYVLHSPQSDSVDVAKKIDARMQDAGVHLRTASIAETILDWHDAHNALDNAGFKPGRLADRVKAALAEVNAVAEDLDAIAEMRAKAAN
jgi:hypothetical protein